MSRMKTLIKYFIGFLIIYVIVDILSVQIIKSTYIDKKLTADFSSPKIEITESKATVTNGSITGTLINDTGSTLKDKLLKLDFFSRRGINVGTKYVDLGEIQNGEKFEVKSLFNFDNVDSIKASLVDKTSIPDLKLLDFSLDDIEMDELDWFVAFFAVVVAFGL